MSGLWSKVFCKLNMKYIHLLIKGKVQGVFFRQSIKQLADSLKLVGFVRNVDDDKVEVCVKGKEDKIQKLISFCKKGPVWAEVKKIDVEEKESDECGFEEKRGFIIKS